MNRNSIVLIIAALAVGALVLAWFPVRHSMLGSSSRPVAAGSQTLPMNPPGQRLARSAALADGIAVDAVVARAPQIGGPGGAVEDQGHLPLESHLLTGGFLNQGATELLGAKSFDAFYDRFDKENFGVTSEMTTVYRDQLDKDLRAAGPGRSLGRLSCATDVCIATVREGRGESWFDGWYESLQSRSALPIMALVQAPVSLPGGDVDHRLMFTTRPGSGGFSLGLNPSRP